MATTLPKATSTNVTAANVPQPAALSCKYHPSAELIEDYHAGDMVCSACGLVVADRVIDVAGEWRNFREEEDKDRSRVGQGENFLFGTDLFTVIEGKPSRTGSKKTTEQKMKEAYKSIVEMCTFINANRCVANAAMAMYKSVYERAAGRGRDHVIVMWGCVYNACRQAGCSRTVKEILAACQRSKKQFGRADKFIAKHLMTNGQPKPQQPQQSQSQLPQQPQQSQQPQQKPAQNPKMNGSGNPIVEYMARFSSLLNLSIAVQRMAVRMAERVVERRLGGGCSPTTVASVVLFLASELGNEKRTSADICRTTGVSERAMKLCLKNFTPHIRDLCSGLTGGLKKDGSQ